MKTKDLTDKQIQEQINELEEENANTQRLSFRRGHGWGDGVMEKRRDKIDHLLSILAMRKFEKKQTMPKTTQPKKQGLTRTWDSKKKQWVYHYTKRTKKAKAKKQPDTKLSQHDKLLLAGEYKIQGKPKEVRKLGKAVTKGVKKTNKATKAKVKTKKKMSIPKDYEVQEVLGVLDMYFHHEYIGTRPTREAAIEYIKTHKGSQTKSTPKKKKRAKAKPQQRTLFRGL